MSQTTLAGAPDFATSQRLSRPYSLAILLACLGALAYRYDILVSRTLESFPVRGEFRKLLSLSEVFSHGFGVLFILVAAFLLAPESRRKLLRVSTCAFGAGILADLVKVVVLRTRPKYIELDTALASTLEFTLPWLRPDWSHATQSFPSAHTATTVGLAIGLAWAFSRGRYLFLMLAVLATLQRIAFGSHFLSDVVFGTVVALVVSGVCFDDRFLGSWFHRWEQGRTVRPSELDSGPEQEHARAA